MTSFTLEENFAAAPAVVFAAWLSSDQHSAMTGGEADCSNKVGETFTAWDGYISGSNVLIESDHKIVQRWRTTEFDPADGDSLLSIEILETASGCKVILHHSEIPEGQPDYRQGWLDHYFQPMRAYFG